MAAARPFWKGYLKLSLVSCPISLYTATSSDERVSFRQINKKTGNRLRQQLVDEDERQLELVGHADSHVVLAVRKISGRYIRERSTGPDRALYRPINIFLSLD